jgi:RNA polymerase sigma-70 factor (TIGR02960 family)
VTEQTLARAQAGDEAAFRELTERYRRDLELHCYRIVGSVQDAEDLVQETLLAAWRSLDGYAGRAAFSTWLYRIATNRCLNFLRDRNRRPREIPPPPDFPADGPAATHADETAWVEPHPDGTPDTGPGPDAQYEAREAISLAFVAGLQHLPPTQRAALVLRDVMGFRAAEVADMLGTTEVAVNSALQRARQAFEERLPAGDRERAPLPQSPREREVVTRFADAFQTGDIDGLVALMTDDALLTMPPLPLAYEGPELIARFLSTVPAGGVLTRFRLVPIRANGQPAFGFYLKDPQCAIARAAGIMVLRLEGDRVASITAFHDTAMLPRFGLPRTLRE